MFPVLKCLLVLPLAIVLGCEPLGGTPPPDISTTPTPQQVQYCRDVMYINPNLRIVPLGYYYEHGFLDDSIAFKFIATADSLSEIFQPEFVPPQELVARDSLRRLGDDIDEPWWDPGSKSLVGANLGVPPPGAQGTRALNVGIVGNNDGTYTVYVYWFET